MTIVYQTFYERRWLPDCGEYDAYGICVCERSGEVSNPIAVFPDISDDPELVEGLSQRCNDEGADPVHAKEIVEDFLL